MNLVFVFLLLFNHILLTSNIVSNEDLQILVKITTKVDKNYKNYIKKTPIQFLKDIKPLINADKNNLLILVNKNIPSPMDYEAHDLVNIKDFTELKELCKNNIKIRKILIKDLINLVKDAKIYGFNITIISAYRTKEYQNFLFEYNVKTYGLKSAENQSARPGHSQHHMGIAIDFIKIDDKLLNTKEGKWLYDNSLKYGFSLSYPKNHENKTGYKAEPWHYMYIGTEACLIQKKYFNNLQYKLIEFWNKNKTKLIKLIKKYIN